SKSGSDASDRGRHRRLTSNDNDGDLPRRRGGPPSLVMRVTGPPSTPQPATKGMPGETPPGPERKPDPRGALMHMLTPRTARRLEVPGGTAARVLDFTAEAEAGSIIIWHSDDPAFPADGV